MITLKQLQVFASIARHGNLGLAADEICLSRGAVSQSLSELERRLGSPLFDRVHPRLQLNDQGRRLQPLAEEVLGRVEEIERQFEQGGELTGSLRLGASQTIGNYLLPALLARQPWLQAAVTITNTQTLCDMVARFELDMALIEGENRHAELETRDWLTDDMLIVAAPTHPLAGQSCLTPACLRGCDWVLREARSGSREQFDRQLAPHLADLGRVLELNTPEAVMQAVEQGLGLALISRLAAANRLAQGRLAVIDVGLRLPRTLALVWHRQKYHSALLHRFVEICREQAGL
ncbi:MULTISPECIES: LysR substrate-binding domain-containing protein [Oceanimonas]|uniref:LysR family transcriptional regulator n=1 Tax=Oceanimonas doudoroffii TaxID=84158 RepID=A0A233RAZ6_9GAMM|nr:MULTISPECIES: LysR substrate-binding domain-containing protein [Oceanimonas]NHI02104.1 HTH-type transcriptional regulator CysL [Oceanimonas sp. MB9]OXY80563.1 LysR family transcriptional regulator [Oceanimonas doudoroffii]